MRKFDSDIGLRDTWYHWYGLSSTSELWEERKTKRLWNSSGRRNHTCSAPSPEVISWSVMDHFPACLSRAHRAPSTYLVTSQGSADRYASLHSGSSVPTIRSRKSVNGGSVFSESAETWTDSCRSLSVDSERTRAPTTLERLTIGKNA